jgi:hypothetical protein
MSNFDVLEDGAPCDLCGNPISFNDDDLEAFTATSHF